MNAFQWLLGSRILCILPILWAFLLANSIARASDPIRVMSYNIRYLNQGDGQDQWNNRQQTVIDTIQSADVIGLQEVVDAQYQTITQKTSVLGLEWYAAGRDDGLRAGEMTPIGWKSDKLIALEHGVFWLSDQPYRVGRKGWDAALPRVATWVRLAKRQQPEDANPATLLVVNAHFDHRGQHARRNSAALLRSWIAQRRDDSAAFVIGDLNAMLDSPPLEELLNPSASTHPPMLDARQKSAKPDDGPNSTWNGFSQIVDGRRIDHILYQGDRVQVLSFTTLDPRTQSGRFGSDHLPIVAEFQY